LSNNNNLYPY